MTPGHIVSGENSGIPPSNVPALLHTTQICLKGVNSGWQVTAMSWIKHHVWIENKFWEIWEDMLSVLCDATWRNAWWCPNLSFPDPPAILWKTTTTSAMAAPQCPLFLGSENENMTLIHMYLSYIVNPLCLQSKSTNWSDIGRVNRV